MCEMTTDTAAKADREAAVAEHMRLDALYAEWLAIRAEQCSGRIDDDDDRFNAASAREHELAKLICTAPALYPWMISRKLEVLRHYLGGDGDGVWTDHRELVLLGGIEADAQRLHNVAWR